MRGKGGGSDVAPGSNPTPRRKRIHTAFVSVGELAIAVGDEITPSLDAILLSVKESLAPRAYGPSAPHSPVSFVPRTHVPQRAVALTRAGAAVSPPREHRCFCVCPCSPERSARPSPNTSTRSVACAQRVLRDRSIGTYMGCVGHFQLSPQLLEQMFATGLSEALINALVDLAVHIPTLLPAIQGTCAPRDRWVHRRVWSLTRAGARTVALPRKTAGHARDHAQRLPVPTAWAADRDHGTIVAGCSAHQPGPGPRHSQHPPLWPLTDPYARTRARSHTTGHRSTRRGQPGAGAAHLWHL